MTDAELLVAFRDTTLTKDDFSHQNHIRVAWLVLRDNSTAEALSILARGLKRLTRKLGVPGLYHETITFAYALLINERLERTGRDSSWAEFSAINPDLLEGKKAALLRYYTPEELDCELARKVFVLPAARVA